jgi:hypothetical protein
MIMTTQQENEKGNVMTIRPNTASHIGAGREPPGGRRRQIFVAAALGAAALAAMSALAAVGAFNGNAAALTNCAAKPSSCQYPDATNTGVPAGAILKSVPSQLTSGPGWSYSATGKNVVVTGKGAVLSNLYITGNLTINASSVTVKNVHVATDAVFGVSFTHTTGVTIENSTISGLNATTGRVDSAIDDVYGDSTGMVIKDNNIFDFRTAIHISTGLVEGNYIHDPGYISGDHTNGFYVNGGTEPLTISGNTIFNSRSQTDAINLDAGSAGVPVANKTVQNNFLAGGSYTLYGGDALGNPTSNIVIKGNRFAQLYYPTSGQFGAGAYFNAKGSGNVWSGNTWDKTGQTIPSP